MDMLLTSEDLECITRAKTARKQKSVLDANGIYYIRRADGSIITTWHHINHPVGPSTEVVNREADTNTPNFGAI